MSVRGKEIDVIILDVGPHMHGYLDEASRALFNYTVTKILNKPTHEIAVILFGTTGTSNSLNEECGEEDYSNISVLQDLRGPGVDTLKLLAPLERGTGTSDFVDALVVALDMVVKANNVRVIQNIPKKFVLISNFLQKAKELDEEFQTQLTESMKAQHVQLQVICLDVNQQDVPPATQGSEVSTQLLTPQGAQCTAGSDGARRVQEENLEVLRGIKAEAGDREIRVVKKASELLGVFRTRDVSFQCVKAELEVGLTMKLRLRVYKKCAFEKLPSLKDMSAHGQKLASIVTSKEWYLASASDTQEGDQAGAPQDGTDAGMPLPLEELTKAYRYGKQFVPFDDISEEQMKYLPGKMLQVIGFADKAPMMQDKRYQFLKDPQLLLPEQDEASQVALSGLVQAMHAGGKAAVVRYARTARAQVALCALLPQLGSATTPDHFIMLNLPFAEDIRYYSFPALAPRPELLPTPAQALAAQALVHDMDLVSNPQGELLKPEETANPTLQRFCLALGRLALGQQEVKGKEEELPGHASEDKLVQASLGTPWQEMPAAARSAEAGFNAVFQTREVAPKQAAQQEQEGAEAAPRFFAGAATSAASTATAAGQEVVLSDEYPAEDFKALVAAGRLEPAVAALAERVKALVDKSVRNRAYPKAISCCMAMREACVQQAEPAPFNNFLRELRERYQTDAAHSGFWDLLSTCGSLTLISSAEVASSDVPPEAAMAFFSSQQSGVSTATLGAAAGLGDLEDLEEME